MIEEKPVLDVCCGPKMMWFNKEHPDVIYQDIRVGDFSVSCKNVLVKPDILGDFRAMRFSDEVFNLIIFDPPHLKWAGKTGRLGAAYGVLNKKTWPDDIKAGFAECWRVLKPGGTLIFKWSEVQIPLKKVIELAPAKPLFGNKKPKQTGTHWLVFYKTEEEEK